jgi:adenylate kinase
MARQRRRRHLETMIIVLFGKPGAGKGTQAPLLAEAIGARTLATGDVLRNAVREGTPQGREAKAFMDRGDLVPDGVILAIVKETLSRPAYVQGAVLDGVVRTVPQAEGLRRMLAELGRQVDVVLYFNIANEQIVQRISGRTVCEKCQNTRSAAPGEPCEQPGCDGRLVRRSDDDPVAVLHRLEVFDAQTAPVLDWYRREGTRVVTIDAVGEVSEITRRALDAIGYGQPV